MKVIDLSLPLYTGMPVYPGDPEASIELIERYEDTGWNMRRLEINGHDATHVNLPLHATQSGKNLDDYALDAFVGDSVLYESPADVRAGLGVVFHQIDIDWAIAKRVAEVRAKFVALPAHFELDVDIERWLLERDVISFERLVNTALLPKRFVFHGAPLNIKAGDGSPVRAYAVIDRDGR